MVNHFRTLLLNREPSIASFPAYYLEEYEPVDFRPLSLPNDLLTVRRALFGENSDRLYENFRAAQYIALLAGSSLSEYLTTFDPRVTLVAKESLFQPLSAWRIYNTNNQTVTWQLLGDARVCNDTQLERKWRIRLLTSSTLYIAHDQTTTTVSYEWDSHPGLRISKPVALPGTELFFSFSEGYSFLDNDGPLAELTIVRRPALSCVNIYERVSSLPAEILNNVFSVYHGDGQQEPLLTFRNCFMEHPSVIYRFGGLLLAYVYRLQRLLTTGS